ncbi:MULTISPECIES: IS66 family transposase [unclassified Marinobacter]|uniref:IS66 family transposase n=1 Tax=unclassified Marinobacter TaxID=83889 RepID=UPI002010A371|nr:MULTISPECIES: IS66 family transposase [unclassified Marinobacter]UQG58267.1 IS66 family transposase [Marinobacter sp. M4C]UQG63924.1 IS66 family transposase [Marinobacter sp. M2C]UQG71353.1 IS66 family transposase [Marinobacter sp. M1C]
MFMKLKPETPSKAPDISGLTAAELLSVVEGLQQELSAKKAAVQQRDQYIQILEELLRWKRIQQFGASSEKSTHQIHLFDEAELEAEIDDLRDQLPDDVKEEEAPPASRKRRQRGFSDKLLRERIELTLSDEDKAGASKTFFTKVKEELQFIPAQLKVLEYWQEKAVFEHNGEERLVAAARPIHPLGKCTATTSLLAYVITSKYADGLPLYRLEHMLKRLGHEISRTSMAHWVIRLEDVFKPLINLMREVQNSSDYLQADETRIQVLKEDGKTAQSDKWMWVTRGGPPGQPSVLFEYDPSRAGKVPVRLLDDFKGILQADGYSGYGKVCRDNNITRIGCWDHARRKYVEATKAAKPQGKGKPTKASKADVALSHINKLYAIERQIKELSVDERYRIRQELSVPRLKTLKTWLEANVSKVAKGTLTRKAMDYTLNQWSTLVGYCERSDLQISNVLAENAIRPFALGRKAWLFADTSRGARASATCYSLVETAKANSLEPSAYIQYVLDRIAEAGTLEKLEALLPWNVNLERASKKVPQID